MIMLHIRQSKEVLFNSYGGDLPDNIVIIFQFCDRYIYEIVGF